MLSYLVLIPAIAYFGGDSLSKVVDETGKALAFNQLGASQIWSNYVRYIGAGAVAAGGLISLIKTFPTMIKTFGHAMKGFGKKGDSQLRTQQDISMKVVLWRNPDHCSFNLVITRDSSKLLGSSDDCCIWFLLCNGII